MIDCNCFSRRAAWAAPFALFVLSLANPAVCRASIRDCLEVGEEISVPDAIPSNGAFVGSFDGVLVIAGGTSPVAAANLENREFSREIWTRDRAGTWTKSDTQLASPRAFGCTVSTPSGIVCIGGRDAQSASANVELIEVNSGA